MFALITMDNYRSEFDTSVALFQSRAEVLDELVRMLQSGDLDAYDEAPPLDDLDALIDWVADHLDFKVRVTDLVTLPKEVAQ